MIYKRGSGLTEKETDGIANVKTAVVHAAVQENVPTEVAKLGAVVEIVETGEVIPAEYRDENDERERQVERLQAPTEKVEED